MLKDKRDSTKWNVIKVEDNVILINNQEPNITPLKEGQIIYPSELLIKETTKDELFKNYKKEE